MPYANHVHLTKQSHFDHRTNRGFARPRTAFNSMSPYRDHIPAGRVARNDHGWGGYLVDEEPMGSMEN